MFGDRRVDLGEERQRGERRAHGEELARRELAQLVGILGREAEQVGRARDVAVEHVEADKEVLQFGYHRRRQLREALGGDDRRDAALAASGREIGQGGDTETAGLRVAGRSGVMRGKEMTFVDADEDGVRPVLARRADQAGEEGGSLDDPLIRIKVGQVEVEGEPVAPAARGGGGQPVGGQLGSAERGGADVFGEVPELALGIDDHRRHEVEGFLDDAAQGPALARARAALNEQAAREEAIEIEAERAGGMASDRHAVVGFLGMKGVDGGHGEAPWQARTPGEPEPPIPLPFRRVSEHVEVGSLRSCGRVIATLPSRPETGAAAVARVRVAEHEASPSELLGLPLGVARRGREQRHEVQSHAAIPLSISVAAPEKIGSIGCSRGRTFG